MKQLKNLETIKTKIAGYASGTTNPALKCRYQYADNSTGKQVRISIEASVRVVVDKITYPKNMAHDEYGTAGNEPWEKMAELWSKINTAATILPSWPRLALTIDTPSRSKSALAERERIVEQWQIEQGNAFLQACQVSAREIAKRRKQIAALQAEQKKLIAQMRSRNSAYMMERKSAAAERRQADQQALTSGEFWKASKDALKGYFYPPFDKNYLADVSEKWRAALFLECESKSYKRYNGEWGHKLVGTGNGYLCGIDDNGDEWGHMVRGVYGSRDDYDNFGFDVTVEEAMAELFQVSTRTVNESMRQGDLLFHPEQIPSEDREVCARCGRSKTDHYPSTERDGEKYLACDYTNGWQVFQPKIIPAVELHPQSGPWEVRESHIVQSPGLVRNGRYFRSDNEIVVNHTSHATITLPAGSYRVYALPIPNAD